MSNTTDNSDIIARIQLATTNIYAYAGLFIFCVGTIGNVFNIIVFTHLRALSKLASSLFLVSSFIGSQLVLSTGVISRVIFGLTGKDPLVSSNIWCKIRNLLGPVGGSVALTCISLASVERYLVTSRQVNRHRYITLQRVRFMICIVVLLWLAAFIPNAVYYMPPSCTITNSVYSLFSSIFSLTAYSTAPLIVLAVFCTLTWLNLHSVRTRTNRIQQQVNTMMIAQICVVLLTSVPNVILQVYNLATRNTVKDNLRRAQEGLLGAVLTTLGFTAHAGSFYIYLAASRRYRKNVISFLFWYKKRPNRVSSHPTRENQRI